MFFHKNFSKFVLAIFLSLGIAKSLTAMNPTSSEILKALAPGQESALLPSLLQKIKLDNPLYKAIFFLKQGHREKAAEILDEVTFDNIQDCLTLIKNDHQTILELFDLFTHSIPTVESLHSSSKHSIGNVKSQWWDFMAAFFGIEESYEILRNEKAKAVCEYFLASEDLPLKKEIIQGFIKSIPFHTFHSSAAQRVAPLALVVINMLQGNKNMFDTSVLGLLPEGELAQSLKNHLYFTIPALWQGQFKSKNLKACPTAFLAPLSDLKKKHYRWLDVATAPKGTGSTALNFLKRVFNTFLPDVKFSFYGTDIMFPPYFYDESSHAFRKAFAHIETTGTDVVNDITFYDGRRPCFNIADPAFDADGKLDQYDFITMVKAIHHFGGHNSVKQLMPLAKNIRYDHKQVAIEWCNQERQLIPAPLYNFDESQQRAVENLLAKLNNEGILFIELCFLHLPQFKFIQSDNEDVFVIIKRLSENKFMMYSQIIPFNPQPYEAYPYVEFLLHGDDAGRTSRYYYRIGMDFPGFIKAYNLTSASETDMSELCQLLKEAHLLVYRYQARDRSPWCQMRDAAQAVREHKTMKEAMQVYMSFVPDSDDKRRILEKIEAIGSKQATK